MEGHAALAARKGVRSASVADGLPELDVDPTRIGQVLANLLSNAVRHTPRGGEVTVRRRPAPDGRVAFTDGRLRPGLTATARDRLRALHPAVDSRGGAAWA